MRDSVTEFRRLQTLFEITSTCWGSSKSIFEVDGGYGRLPTGWVVWFRFDPQSVSTKETSVHALLLICSNT